MPENYKYTNHNLFLPDKQMLPMGFAIQHDVTVATEVLPPPFGSIREIVPKLDNFWNEWLKRYPFHAPLFKGSGYNATIGGHHHVGLRHRPFVEAEAYQIIRHLMRIYPLTISIMTNDFKVWAPEEGRTRALEIQSNRGTNNSRVIETPLTKMEEPDSQQRMFVPMEHYQEIHWTEGRGTIELRQYDSNIPQAHMAVSFLEKVVVLAALDKMSVPPNPGPNKPEFEIQQAIKFAFNKIDYQKYLEWFFANYEKYIIQAIKEEQGELPSAVEEILYMASKGVTIQNLVKKLGIYDSREKEFFYFRQMVSKTDKFFKNLEDLGYSIPEVLRGKIEWSNSTKQALETYVPDFNSNPESLLRIVIRWQEMQLPESKIVSNINRSKNFNVNKILDLVQSIKKENIDNIFELMDNMRDRIPTIRRNVLEINPNLIGKLPAFCLFGTIYSEQELATIADETGLSNRDIMSKRKYRVWMILDEEAYKMGQRKILGHIVISLKAGKMQIVETQYNDKWVERQASEFIKNAIGKEEV